MHVIIAYDISDHRLRHKIFSLLKEKGAHSQKSVFECEMDKAELDALRRSLQQLDLGANDSIVFYPPFAVAAPGRATFWGKACPCSRQTG